MRFVRLYSAKNTNISYTLVRDLLQNRQHQPRHSSGKYTDAVKAGQVFTFSHPFLQHLMALMVSMISMRFRVTPGFNRYPPQGASNSAHNPPLPPHFGRGFFLPAINTQPGNYRALSASQACLNVPSRRSRTVTARVRFPSLARASSSIHRVQT